MAISFEYKSDFTERRRMGRAPLSLEVSMRERGCSQMTAQLLDLNSFGCSVNGLQLVQPDTQVWIRLPGLASLSVRTIWSQGSKLGLEFDTPLHPAVAARFLPAEGSHAAALLKMPAGMHDPLLSRREQIMAGITATEHSPLQRKKKPSGLGMHGRINRLVSRRADHRAEPRYTDAVPEGTALSVEGKRVQVINVSSSGMRITGFTAMTDIGDDVAVEFGGFDPMAGLLVWVNGSEAGIALPSQSIELFDRAAS